MEYAYGVLGLSVEELAGLTPFTFELKCKGYEHGKTKEEHWFRNVAWFAVAPHLDPKKHMTINKLWPMADDETQSKPHFTKKKMNDILKTYIMHKQKRLDALVN